MTQKKVIRTICYFSDALSDEITDRLNVLQKRLLDSGFEVQTIRLCAPITMAEMAAYNGGGRFLGVGAITYAEFQKQKTVFYGDANIACNMELANEEVTRKHVDLLFDIIQNRPGKTFNFSFVFNNAPSSPYLPSATYLKNGFAVGLQPTDLAEDCDTLEQWLENMRSVWDELVGLFSEDKDFLGIDSSIAPFFEQSSLVGAITRLQGEFSTSVTTPVYTKLTKFIKEDNPRPIGLCGLMVACLEDDQLAAQYELGNFTIERNIFLSLHSGLGIDVYPIGIDEDPARILDILHLVQSLSNKYMKPLSVRFVSDGVAKIGERTNFQNEYLKDVTVRAL